MKKTTLAAVFAGAMVLALASCGGKKDSVAKVEVQIGGGYTSKELKVNIWDNNQRPGLQKIADEWSAISGVKVRVEVVDWDNYWTLLEAGASGGEMPDVFWMHSNTAQRYMENDLLLDLDPYIAADSSINMSDYYQGITDLYTRKDGKHFAIPKDHDTIALLYNKSILDKYGVKYPDETWTWEDLYTAAAKITNDSGNNVYGFAMNTSNNQDGWYNLVYAYGGKVITDDRKGTTIGSKESKDAMEMMRKILTVSAPQTVVAETGTDSLFMSGKTAMITQGSWMIQYFYTAENAKDYAWAVIPYCDRNGNGTCEKNERWSSYNGLGWAAAFNTKDPNAAWGLIAYFCAKKGQEEQAQLGITLAAIPGISDAFSGAFAGMDVSAFSEVEESGSLFFRPYTRNTVVWENAIQQDAFLAAWQNPTNGAIMAEACDKAQEIIERAIANE